MSEITVNGRKFDAQTGQPLDAAAEVLMRKNSAEAKKLHSVTERSKTLNRKFVSAPKNTQANMISQFKRRHDDAEFRKMSETFENVSERSSKQGRTIPRRNSGVRLTPIESRGNVATISKVRKNDDARGGDIQPYRPHPLQKKAYAQMLARQDDRVLPSMSEIKQNAIASALGRMSEMEDFSPVKSGPGKRKIAIWALGVILATVAIVVIGVVINLPQITINMASAQSGFSATIPQYLPQHYKLTTLPYNDKKSIVMKFSKGDTVYELRQSESSWNSAFLKEYYVLQNFGKDFETYKERGITVFRSSDGRAVWVNGGRLFEMKSDEYFIGEEIVAIATSL